jgi:type IV fimbrial biogenesis protein FimT
MKRSAGLGLIEMLIAVAIMAVLLALAMPGFQTFIRNTQVRTAAESIHAGLNLARTEALRRNARVSLWMVNATSASCARSSSGTSWVVSLDDPAGRCDAAHSETVAPRLIQSRSGSDGSGIVSVSAVDGATASATSCITFNGFGSPESTCAGGGAPIARVIFTSATAPSASRTLELRIINGGAIRLCDPAVTSASDPAYC